MSLKVQEYGQNSLGFLNPLNVMTPMPSLVTSEGGFKNCTMLSTFISDTPNLMNGTSMFENDANLQIFISRLDKLVNGTDMFKGCTNLQGFNIEFESLDDASYLFEGEGLEIFDKKMSNLLFADGMFDGCKLTLESVWFLAMHLNNVTEIPGEHKITIGLGCTDSEFRAEGSKWHEAIAYIGAKGWEPTIQHNG